ncbi:MAG TPA: efflux RND transporter periplasmic adaptor subunit, partial [Pirellulales bacterium]
MSRYSLVAASLVGLSALVGCEQRNQLAKMPPPTVTVARPVKEDVVDYVEFTGVTRAAARVELRARVKGMLIEIRFKDGAIVQKGDLLFVIDPKPYVNAQKSAAATLQKAQASLGLAEQQLARTKELLARNATSQEALDSQNAQRAVALADVASAEAALKTADLNLGYTEVRAPLTGRISENLVDVGNLVQAETTVLAHIESVDPMQAYFTVSERDVARLAEANARAAGELSTPDTTPSEPPTDSPKTNAEEDPAKKATSEVDPPMPVVSKAATDAKAGAGTSETDELVDVSEAGSADDGVRVSQTQVSMALGDTGKYEFEGRLDYEEFGVDA